MIRLDTSQRGIFSETLTFTTSGSNAGGFSGTIRGGGCAGRARTGPGPGPGEVMAA